jgi:hypothetical protein
LSVFAIRVIDSTPKLKAAPRSLDLGLRHHSRADLEAVRAAGQVLHIQVLALPALTRMSRPSLPAPRSRRSRCWERCTPARRSRPLSPIGFGDRPRLAPRSVAQRTRTRARAARRTRPNPTDVPTGRRIRPSSRGRPTSFPAQKALDMNDRLQRDMLEATSLTRAGRLTEATSLLQRLLRGERAPKAQDDFRCGQRHRGRAGRTPRPGKCRA